MIYNLVINAVSSIKLLFEFKFMKEFAVGCHLTRFRKLITRLFNLYVRAFLIYCYLYLRSVIKYILLIIIS